MQSQWWWGEQCVSLKHSEAPGPSEAPPASTELEWGNPLACLWPPKSLRPGSCCPLAWGQPSHLQDLLCVFQVAVTHLGALRLFLGSHT